MRVGVPRETTPGERRVALVPETVGKLAAAGFELVVEQGAGTAASFPDDAYTEAGATLGDPWEADGVVKVRKPSAEERRAAPHRPAADRLPRAALGPGRASRRSQRAA